MAENVLSWRKIKAINAILTSSTIGEASQVAGVSTRTITRWLQEDAFSSALRSQQEAIITNISRRLIAGLESALDTLQDLFHAKSEGVRKQAVSEWIDKCLELREQTDIERRLTELERRL